MKRKVYYIFLVIIIITITVALSSFFYEDELNGNQSEFLEIGIALPIEYMSENTKIIQLYDQAVEDINNEGGILGKQVKLIYKNDNNSVTNSLEIAQEFSLEENINIVIGHWLSTTTLAAREIYENNNILLVSSFSTAPKIKNPSYENVVVTITTEEVSANVAHRYIVEKGYKNIAIYYDDKDFAEAFAREIEKKDGDNINIIDKHSNFVNEAEFNNTFEKWELMDVDLVIISGVISDCADVIDWIKSRNPELSILGGNAFAMENRYDYLSENPNNVSFLSLINNNREEYKIFSTNFYSDHGYYVNDWELRAYDNLFLLKEAIEKANSLTDIDKIKSAYIHDVKLDLPSGYYDFDENGHLISNSNNIVIKEIINNNEVNYIFKEVQ